MFFKDTSQTHKQPDITTLNEFAMSSSLGKGIASNQSAKEELFRTAAKFNPLSYLVTDKYFLGLDHLTGEPLYLSNKDVVHSLVTAPTRAGKGIYFGFKAIETIKQNRSLIIIDPKEDEWLPQVCLEQLKRDGRENDFIIWNWEGDFKYKVFEGDNFKEAAKKLTIMLNLIEVEGEAGASHYRKNERIALKKVIQWFFNSKELLGVEFKRDIPHLILFLRYLVEDLTNKINYELEYNKPKPNINLLEQASKRYFDIKLFEKVVDFGERNLATLESLLFSMTEFEDVKFTESSSILDGITGGKVIYIKSDMLDESALKFLKFIIADVVAKSKKHKKTANCLVLADEISFYPTPILSSALSTIAGFGTHFFLAYQDDGQIQNENLKSAIKSNCQTKIYYKSSDIKTLEYIEEMSGKELVTKVSKKGNESTFRQEQEEYLNITKQRALPKSQVAILIQESLCEPLIFDTYPVPVAHPFDWDISNNLLVEIELNTMEKSFVTEEFLNEKKQQNTTTPLGENITKNDELGDDFEDVEIEI